MGIASTTAASAHASCLVRTGALSRQQPATSTALASALPIEGQTAYRLERTGNQSVSAYPAQNHTAAPISNLLSSAVTRGRQRVTTIARRTTIAASVAPRSR